MRRQVLLMLTLSCLLAAITFAAGYFEAWRHSLSRQYAASELIVDLDLHYLRRLRERGQLDSDMEKEMSGMILAQLGSLLTIRNLKEQPMFWPLRYPGAFLQISQQVPEPHSSRGLTCKSSRFGRRCLPARRLPRIPKGLAIDLLALFMKGTFMMLSAGRQRLRRQ